MDFACVTCSKAPLAFDSLDPRLTQGLWEGSYASSFDPGGFQIQAQPAASAPIVSGQLVVVPVLQPTAFHFKQCWHCEPDFGVTDGVCEAMKLLESLSSDVDSQLQRVEDDDMVCAFPAWRLRALSFLFSFSHCCAPTF
jgi:hypothetical protein